MGYGNIASGLIQGVMGIVAGTRARDAESELENMQVPTYRRNQSILDFYNTALQKYKTQPTETAEYKLGKQQIGQNTIQGLKEAQSRRSGLAILPTLISGQNNSLLKLAAKAEQDKSRQASIVSQAAGPAQAELDREYQYNQIWPFQKKYNLLAMKAAALSKRQTANEQGALSALSSIDSMGGFGGGMGGGSGGGGSTMGGGLGGLNMSDKRLKYNYFITGKSPSGINIYEFSYLGSNDRFIGVMADEVPQSSVMTKSGFYAVDYSKIDVQFKAI